MCPSHVYKNPVFRVQLSGLASLERDTTGFIGLLCVHRVKVNFQLELELCV